MINNLKLRDFKIHANIEIQLGNITMLTGQNGMGKSSIIQSLLLLRQSCNSQTGLAGVNLKGDLTDLGGANDVECHSSSDGILDIRLSNNTEELVFRFSYDVDSYETFLPIIEPIPHISDLAKFTLFTNKFQYSEDDKEFRYLLTNRENRDTLLISTEVDTMIEFLNKENLVLINSNLRVDKYVIE